jgi:uncharacterized protein (TIGR03083 family)
MSAMLKETSLAEMHASFAEVMAVVEAIPPDRLTAPGVTDDWSVRDVLAHEAAYERYTAEAIFGDLAGIQPSNLDFYGYDEAPTEDEEAADDSMNDWVVERARRRPVEDILAEFRWAHDRLVEAVETCSESDLTDPDRFPSFEGRSVIDALPGQCWGHHREHLVQMERFARG